MKALEVPEGAVKPFLSKRRVLAADGADPAGDVVSSSAWRAPV